MSASRQSDLRFEEIDEQVSVVLRFPEDRLAQFTGSFGAYDYSSLTVIGEKGRVRLIPASRGDQRPDRRDRGDGPEAAAEDLQEARSGRGRDDRVRALHS